MLELIHESGWGAWPTLLAFVVGLGATITLGRRLGRPGSVAAAWAAAVMALAMLGVSTGQRAVDNYVQTRATTIEEKVEAVSVGTREASTNLLFGGACGTLLMIVGGVLSLAALRKKP